MRRETAIAEYQRERAESERAGVVRMNATQVQAAAMRVSRGKPAVLR